ncbi:MAG: alanine--tRNA ligase [Elusimicrobia bacterium RIFOXYA2_FULL_39_19]|nr:MAG: alanine--tRNA ligase [Elusimicrobia bacterium RIFOXYA2_FULL_39_19]
MTGNELRKAFLDYFKQNGHKAVHSDSLIPSSDPTLLFTSAGMVQFKKYFLGEDKMDPPRVTSSQKCFRTSDLDSIGYTARHLSFFEMLGNFSFGDYFKKEAIKFAWEFLTEVAKLDKDRLHITVYKDDTEALELWKTIVPENRIYKLGDDTNFWTMGPTGPCGPCSEILYDNGIEFGCKKPNCTPACSCDRWLEIWNLVFTQFDRTESGELKPLKNKNIDTGMGLERLTKVVTGKANVFETDLFFPIITELENLFDCKYGTSQDTDITLKIIADHARAATFLIADGILPSNEGRGYLLRRIIRRALRRAKLMNYDKPFLHNLTGKVIEIMKDNYTELPQRKVNISAVTKMEEEKFIETLDTGMLYLNEMLKKHQGAKTLSGKDVFYLYETYGFPQELTKEILTEKYMSFDENEYKEAQEAAREIAKTSWKETSAGDTSLYKHLPETTFVGYKTLVYDSVIKGIIKDAKSVNTAREGDMAEIILDITPFYAESGGQVGDTGKILLNKHNGIHAVAEVIDTQKPVENVIIHMVKILKGDFFTEDRVKAEVDIENRKNIMRHHTATHLLHKALKAVLGEHANQAGSMVAPERFRFDFVHFKALNSAEISKIEDIVNDKIMECLPVGTEETTLKQARAFNATALFGEKYKDDVRLVYVGSNPQEAYSLELCGGTHCTNTGQIGVFKITAETSVGSGLRRIEGICGKTALKYFGDHETVLNTLNDKLKTNTKEIVKRVDFIFAQQKTIEKEIEKLRTNPGACQGSCTDIDLKNNLKLQVQKLSDPGLNPKTMRTLSDNLKEKAKTNTIVMIINTEEDKLSFVVSATKDVIASGYDVSKLAGEFAKLINGSAGGRKDFAQGGGKDLSVLDSAISKLKDIF